jgi:hypothetical protein
MNEDWTGGYSGGPTPGGSGMADYQAGAAARALYDQSRKAMEDAHAPMNLGGSSSTTGGAAGYAGGYAGNYGGSYGGAGPRVGLSIGGLFVLLCLGAVLLMNTSVLLASVLVTGALAGAIVGTVFLWPTVRLWSPGAHRSLGQIFQAALAAMCAYGAAMYLLTHYGGPMLNPLDRHLQQWVGTSPLFAGLHWQPRVISFLVLTQVPSVLACGAVIRWRLKGAFKGVTGYLGACALSLAILIVVGLGATLFVREVFDHASLSSVAKPQASHATMPLVRRR